MNKEVNQIIQSWKKKEFKPIYWFDGEEHFFVDKLVEAAEELILSDSEKSFNLTIFYGKDAEWTNVVNTCMKYPMFAERQLVILKEAQLMDKLEKLEHYFSSPLMSTIFVVAYKGKSFDKRTKFFKVIEKNALVYQTPRIYENKVHDWILEYVKSIGLSISPKAAHLLHEHIGNDLSRIAGEIEKLRLNLKDKEVIDEDSIEKFIGVSKEYNVFELGTAIAARDTAAAMKIIAYFEANPKAAPIQMATPALYAIIGKVYSIWGLQNTNERALFPLFGNNPVTVKAAQLMMKNYGFNGVSSLIILLQHYNMKGLGVGDSGTESASLLKEMVSKMLLC